MFDWSNHRKFYRRISKQTLVKLRDSDDKMAETTFLWQPSTLLISCSWRPPIVSSYQTANSSPSSSYSSSSYSSPSTSSLIYYDLLSSVYWNCLTDSAVCLFCSFHWRFFQLDLPKNCKESCGMSKNPSKHYERNRKVALNFNVNILEIKHFFEIFKKSQKICG